MKKTLALLLTMLMVVTLAACTTSVSNTEHTEPIGTYYSEKLDGVYYEFDGKSTCYLKVENPAMQVKYVYAINEESEEFVDDDDVIHRTYVVHISDTNSDALHKLVFDSTNDTIYDSDYGLFSKK